MGIFSGIGTATYTKRGNYITPGDYRRLKLRELRYQESRKKGAAMVIAEFEVIEFRPTVKTMEEDQKTASGVQVVEVEAPVWKLGDVVTDVIGFQHLNALGNLKMLLEALVPGLAEEITSEAAKQSKTINAVWEGQAIFFTGPSNPLAGFFVRCIGVGGRTKEKNLPITYRNYEAIEETEASATGAAG